ncbi:MAG: AmmeMemoRadiSam system protein B [bacterium]
MKRLGAMSLALIAIVFVSANAACKKAGEVAPVRSVQQPTVAGTFYPADAKTLSSEVQGMIERAAFKKLDGRLIGVIVPHAGYQYSGRIAAAAFKQLSRKGFTRAVVIAPAHRSGFRGVALSPFDSYRTPLGDIPIDAKASAALTKNHAWAKLDAKSFEGEHAAEVELPFLQVALGYFKLIPIMVGQVTKQEMDDIALALDKELGDGSTVFVASSDLSHFHNYEEAQEKDSLTVGMICTETPDNFLSAVEKDSAELCGFAPVYMMKRIAEQRGAKFTLLEYANSGDVTGDKSRVVGYAAIAVVVQDELAAKQKEELLALAKNTLAAHLAGASLPPLPQDPILAKDGAAFVTLKKRGELRGCIGMIEAMGPLNRTVQEMTIAAASEDPRFPPVKPEEEKDISIEISVLTPPEELSDPLAVRVGTDGLIIEQGFSRGVLLPQVPIEQGWDKMQYLQAISQKANLPPDAYKRAKLYRFQAIVFGEGK